MCALILFLVGGLYLERTSYFFPLKQASRNQSVPTALLHYGVLGDIIKQLSLVKVVPNNIPDKSLVHINVHANVKTRFKIYWAGKKQKYFERRSSFVRINAEKYEYRFFLTDLKNIRRLRIDPAERPSNVLIKSIIIKQEGYEPITFLMPDELKRLTRLNDIQKLSVNQEGLAIVSSGDDPQLQAYIKPRKVGVRKFLFPRKRQVGEYLYKANPGGAKDLPSTRVIEEEDFKKGWPLISVWTDEDNLYSREKGIIRNWRGHGKDWEHLAYVSYYDKEKLLFATGAGLRLHGTSTRNSPVPSFKVYFRKEYGMNQIEPGILFSSETKPIKRLVISTDRSDPRFENCFALDIARKIGCITPEIKPTIFFLNGEWQSECAYFLIEHVNKRQWISRLRHKNFVFFRLDKVKSEKEEKPYKELQSWFNKTKKITMKEVSKRINIDNLSRWVIATVFCGNWDFRQGAAVLDKNNPNPKWFWVMWDMDTSFRDKKSWGFKGKLWQQRGFSLTWKNYFIMNLFRRLMVESPEYNKYFMRLVMDLLNHRINPHYFTSRIEHYEKLSNALYDTRPYFNSKAMRQFLEKRPFYIRADLQKRYGISGIRESLSCKVKGPVDIKYQIDGYPEGADYQGWYYAQETIDIRIVSPHRIHFSHWMVNGKKISDTHLIFPITNKTDIEPVFKDNMPMTAQVRIKE